MAVNGSKKTTRKKPASKNKTRKSTTHPKKSTSKPVQKPRNQSQQTVLLGLVLIVLVILGFLILLQHVSPSRLKLNTQLSWQIQKLAQNHDIEGYASNVSTLPGETLGIHVSCKDGSYKAEVYRMGYYKNSGALLVTQFSSASCNQEPQQKPDSKTGLVNLNWPVSLDLQIPKTWEPGIYLVKLTSAKGYQNYVPFTVRSDKPLHKYLFVHAVNTDNAYNDWGGDSLYNGKTPALGINRAVEVSFNRPFSQYANIPYPKGANNKDGSGFFLYWEYPMIKFLEKYGYQTDYLTDVDIEQNPQLLKGYKTIIISGHNEYWSKNMLNGYEAAVSNGTNLAVFAGNTAYRPIRFKPDANSKQPDRIIVDYKDSHLDPQHEESDKSTVTAYNWSMAPLFRPESELLGIDWGNENADNGKISGDLKVNDSKSWVFAGTGLKNGQILPGLVGYEYDRFDNDKTTRNNVDIVFHSPVFSNNSGERDFADASYYKMPQGGQVFDAGTVQWSWGLDTSNSVYSPPLVRITRNILDRFGQ